MRTLIVLAVVTLTAALGAQAPAPGAAVVKAGRVFDVDGDPLANIADLEKIVFVMKGGAVIRDDARARPAPQS